MTDAALKNIFSRFRDLNLVFLIRDLENGQVAVGVYASGVYENEKFGRDSIQLCPLAHGCGFPAFVNESPQTVSKILGITWLEIQQFLGWWDSFYYQPDKIRKEARGKILVVLRSILHERMADADAVQRVTGRQPPEFAWSKTDYSARKKALEFSKETVSAI